MQHFRRQLAKTEREADREICAIHHCRRRDTDAPDDGRKGVCEQVSLILLGLYVVLFMSAKHNIRIGISTTRCCRVCHQLRLTLDDQPIFVPPMGMSFGLHSTVPQALSAVTQPNKSRAVFAYALKECPPVRSPEYVLLISCLSCLIILQRNDPHFGERSAHAHPILRRRASSRTRRCGTRLENLCITFILSSRHQWLVVSVQH